MREIAIRGRLNGYEVTVGCQTIVLEGGPDKLCLELLRYLTNPAQVEQEYLRKFGEKGSPTNLGAAAREGERIYRGMTESRPEQSHPSDPRVYGDINKAGL